VGLCVEIIQEDAEPPGNAVNKYLLDLYGPDPFARVFDASNAHREEHARALPGGEQECGVFPSDATKMRVLTTLVRATGARRILEIGCGLGYSALWLADAAGQDAAVETIERFPAHADLARGFATEFGLGERVHILLGEGDNTLAGLSGQYDFIHDDGWFGHKPAYYDSVVELLRPGGIWVLSNWFLLAHAITGQAPMDWARFAGPRWAEDVTDYARAITSDPRLYVSYIMQPAWVALAVKR
jgi:predicted O-methyltransferase YrrM